MNGEARDRLLQNFEQMASSCPQILSASPQQIAQAAQQAGNLGGSYFGYGSQTWTSGQWDTYVQGWIEVCRCRSEANAELLQRRERLGAEQSGIQTLGQALSTLLAPNKVLPIMSQSDLTVYESQQQQAVAGDGSDTSSLTENAAASVMNSSPDNNSDDSVQSELDSAIDSANSSSSASSANSMVPSTSSGSPAEVDWSQVDCAPLGYSDCPKSEQAKQGVLQQLSEWSNQLGAGSPEIMPPASGPVADVKDCISGLVDITKTLYNNYWNYGTCSNEDHPVYPPVYPVPQPPEIPVAPGSSGPGPAPLPGPASAVSPSTIGPPSVQKP